MSVLLIASDADGDTLSTAPSASSPLARSLRDNGDAGWTFDPGDGEPFATISVSADTVLRPGTLDSIRDAFAQYPAVEALIGDAIVDGQRRLRPAWSPTALAADPAELDLVAVRGAARAESLAARIELLAKQPLAAVAHLPVALIERTTAARPDAAAVAAARRLTEARATRSPVSSATVLIPTAGTHRGGNRLVDRAIDAARRSGLGTVEILLVVGDEFAGDPEELTAPDVALVRRSSAWNFSAAINTGLLAASHDTVLLLNDDVEAIHDGWALPLVGHLRDPEVSLVGAALLYPDRTVQHLGVVVDDALPLHAHVGRRLEELSVGFRHPREVAAVTAACAVGRRADLLAVGGLNEALPANFNDVDLCFKLQREVGRVIVDPSVPLIHHESASRVATIESWEWERFVGRWGEIVDPWYHPGHHRPDDPHDRRRNADHLDPDDPLGSWALRTPTIHPRVHRARLEAPIDEVAAG